MKKQQQRNNKGQFIKGGGGGPGRPTRDTEKAYIEAAMSQCDPETWGQIVAQAVKDCLDPHPIVRKDARNFMLKVLHGNSPSILMQYASFTALTDEQQSDEYSQKLADRISRMLEVETV